MQNAWIQIIHQEGVRSVAMIEEINGCPHEEARIVRLAKSAELIAGLDFGEAGISPLYLFLGALVPTLNDGAALMLLR